MHDDARPARAAQREAVRRAGAKASSLREARGFAPPPPVQRRRPRRPLRAVAVNGPILLAAIAVGLLVSAWVAGHAHDKPGVLAAVAHKAPHQSFSARQVAAERASYTTLVARARVSTIKIYRRAKAGTVKAKLPHRVVNGKRIPLVLMVDGRKGDWLKVSLPVRPNGSTGWVRRRDVTLAGTDYSVRVDVVKHRLTAYHRGKVFLRARIGTGTAVTPTPHGHYFVTDLIRPKDKNGIYGAFAFGLSAFSPVLTSFNGGPGQVGLHGTNEPKALGTNVSHGCIRVRNEVIRKLAKVLPLGTPIEITGKR